MTGFGAEQGKKQDDEVGNAAAGGLQVVGAYDVAGAADVLVAFKADDVAAKLSAGDDTLWGPDAQPESSKRLGWLDLASESRALVEPLAKLREELVAEGLDHIVLAGMGGSSLAPEVITETVGKSLVTLDTTDAGQVRAALAENLDRTILVVSSKSGGTVETDSHRRAYVKAFVDAGLSEADANKRLVVVTDPGSPLEKSAKEAGVRAVFLANPNVGGRYSALTAFGLVPSALAGIDISELLDQAEAVRGSLADPDGPAVALGVALGAAYKAGRDKIVIASDGTGLVGLGDWAEQLLAESTGKEGKGILPVAVESPTAAGTTGDDVLAVTVGGSLHVGEAAGAGRDVAVNGPLGAQFLVWEFATALAGRVIGINPFDQPDVEAAKQATRDLLANPASAQSDTEPVFTDGPVQVFGPAELLAGASTVDDAIGKVLGALGDHGYVAVQAYLDRHADKKLASVRDPLSKRSGHAVTFGWGPRFLHSTGQFHKGGTPVGVFLQITGVVADDLEIPNQPFSFGTLQKSQAAGDGSVLEGRGRPVFRFHLTDRSAGIDRILKAVESTG
ncbi:glucose-6-phosphate isomerase [Fodinicola feengrottensis]|uniref:Glucose-6-phosphate isomerase n=1 Tax=Fodinicola feengrottensis TaxID=435914 RepID=A0ABN2ISV4_9ACTN